MKAMNKLGSALRTIGVVLLVIVLALSIYNLATGNSSWKTLSAELTKNGVSTGLINRMKFDHALFPAMSEAALDADATMAVRSAEVAEHFAGFAKQVEKKKPEVQQKKIDEVYAYYNNDFDAVAYGATYELWQDRVEDREIAAAIAALDAYTQTTGKKMAKLTISCASYMEGYYADLSAANGEEAGSYLEFLLTVQAMIEQAKAEGTAITGAEAYVKASFDYETYKAQLAVVQSAERASEAGMLDEFAELAAVKAEGGETNFPAFFETVYANLGAAYPEDKAVDYHVFLTSMKSLLEQGANFDGSYATIRSTVQEAQIAANNASFTSFLSSYSRTVVETAEGSTVFAYLWMVSGQVFWIFAAGVALIILGVLVKKAVYATLLHRMEVGDVDEDDDVLLSVKGLKQYFRNGDYVNKAVDDVNFYIKKGEVFGLVGESGCGKTTTGRTIINLYDPTEGDVYFQGLRISSSQNGLPVLIRSLRNEADQKITALKEQMKKNRGDASVQAECKAEIKQIKAKLAVDIEAARDAALESSVEKSKCVQKYREKRKHELTAEYAQDAKNLTGEALEERKQRYQVEMKVASKDNIMTRMQMIFQDPIASINPRMTVREIIAEGLIIRGVKDKKYIDEKVYEMLELVGLVREHADRYPHEFSGGQRQRIGIARAIVMQPDLIIADEPISALDVSIQAQVINLLNDLRNRMGLTILFIAHNLSVVKYFSDRIAVMYFGKIVELATSDELFEHPLHPYTKSLLSAIPYPDPHYEKQRQRITYKPAESHDYSVDKPSMHEITPGHFIYCNEAELEQYKKELAK